MKAIYKFCTIGATLCILYHAGALVYAIIHRNLLMAIAATLGILFFLWIVFVVFDIKKMDKDQ